MPMSPRVRASSEAAERLSGSPGLNPGGTPGGRPAAPFRLPHGEGWVRLTPAGGAVPSSFASAEADSTPCYG